MVTKFQATAGPAPGILASSPGKFPKCVGLEAYGVKQLLKWPFLNGHIAASKEFKS